MYISAGLVWSTGGAFLLLSFWLWWERRENQSRKKVLNAIHLWGEMMEQFSGIASHPHLPHKLQASWRKHVFEMTPLLARVDEEFQSEAEHLNDLADDINTVRWHSSKGYHLQKKLISWGGANRAQ